MITIGFTWWNGLLAVVSLAVGVTFTAHAFLVGRDRPIFLAHGLMGLAMAGMFWPSGGPTPSVAGIVVFALIGAWFAAGWLRGRSRRLDDSAHVVVGSGAMVLMYLTHGDGAQIGHGEQAGHALHGGGATTAGGPGALLAAGGLLFTGYFLWHTWELLTHRTTPVPSAETTGTVLLRDRVAPRAETAAHVGMSLLMAVMFLGTI